MKIQKATVLSWHAKLKTPFKIATGAHTALDNLLFVIELADGTQGYGEAAIATHITGETVRDTRLTLQAMAKHIKQRSVTDYLDLFLELETIAGKNRCALAAAEMALLDAFTRLLGEPLWKIFGNRCGKFQSDMTIVIGSVEESEIAARQIKKDGFKVIKLKVGKNPKLDLERVIAIHCVAPEIKLILDANQGFSAKTALKFIADLEKVNIKPILLEQPVPKNDLKGLLEVSRKSKVLVCADESASSVEDVQTLIQKGFRGAVNIKFVKFGIYRAWEAAQLCKKNKLKLMMGVMMESEIATTAAAHFVAGVGGFDFIDLDSAYFMKDKITSGYTIGKSGTYDLSKIKSGIGVQPN